MPKGPLWLAQQLIPPLLLTYFYYAWRVCTFEVGQIYSILPTLFIGPITILYLRLYLLPSSQSVPPKDPPLTVQSREIIFQCLLPAQAGAIRLAKSGAQGNSDGANRGMQEFTGEQHHEGNNEQEEGDSSPPPMVERCYRGKCGGRWKPARTRHCSQCRTCRGGFDHHCPFFANCLTAAYMPTFLALLLYTPPAILSLSSPLYKPFFHRASQAYATSWADERIRSWWWDWTWSWVVAGGPVGRYAGGVILGWRELDRIDAITREGDVGPGLRRLNVGLMLGFGVVLALISAGLAFSTITILLSGHLTIDRGRTSAHAQAVTAIYGLKIKGLPIPDELEEKLWRFSDRTWFFVPLPLPPRSSTPVDSSGTRASDPITDETPKSRSNRDPTPEEQERQQERQQEQEQDPLIKENQGVLVKGGAIIPTLTCERPYDHGPRKNMQIILGTEGYGWLLPWNALRPSRSREGLFLWPLAPGVESRLRAQAEKLQASRDI
ncbi:hypothetical protein IAT40_008009 [Kwoniella sp. CBS 6097]